MVRTKHAFCEYISCTVSYNTPCFCHPSDSDHLVRRAESDMYEGKTSIMAAVRPQAVLTAGIGVNLLNGCCTSPQTTLPPYVPASTVVLPKVMAYAIASTHSRKNQK